MDEAEDHPLLHTAALMHELLRSAAHGETDVEAALARLRNDLAMADEPSPLSDREIRERVEYARRYLAAAALIAPANTDRFRATERGHCVLRNYPNGIDESVLARFPEFKAFIRENAGPPPAPSEQTAYDEGYDAYTRGAHPADNPYPLDSAGHSSWENGWFEARDEDTSPAT